MTAIIAARQLPSALCSLLPSEKMAAPLALKRGATSANAGSLFNKLLSPFRSVSPTLRVGRYFNTGAGSSDVTPYEDDKRSVDVSRRPGSAVSCRLNQDLFSGRRGWDVKEDDECLWLRFDMPGLEKENMKISVEQDTATLIIRGESESEEEPPRRYSRRIVLMPNRFKVDEIKAEMKNGVLKIRVPKVKEEERKDVRQIPVG